jgi:hypothetical protein
MTAKNPRPLTQPEPGDPNHGKSSYQPGSLHTTDLPMQPSLGMQQRTITKGSVITTRINADIDDMINCPKIGKVVKIHDCVLTDCNYEKGHLICTGKSYVHCSFCEAIHPSLKEQMHGAEKDPVQVQPFDHKACILCDHVIVQKILGNKCGKSGSLCCNLKECPIEARKRREAARPVLPDKTCDPSCPCRTPVCEETCSEYQFKERFASWLAVNYPSLDIKSHQDIVDNASGLFDEFWADRS